MRNVWTLAVVALLSSPFSFAEHGGESLNPGPLGRRQGESSGASLDQLKSNVKEQQNTGSDAWWQSARELLDQLTPEQSSAFADELGQDRRGTLFRAANSARQADGTTLRGLVRSSANADAREAASREMEDRLKDPNSKFISSGFHVRPETGVVFASDILAAKNDPAKAAELMAKLMGTLNSSQRDQLKALAEGALEGVDPKLKEWVQKAVAIAQGTKGEGPFGQAFEAAYEKVLGRNKDFQQVLANALAGDAQARQDLLKRFGRDSLMDFISAQLKSGNDGLATDLAKAVARKDNDGNLYLDLNPDNAAFPSSMGGQSLFLGNERANEQIRAALSAFDLANATDHGDTTRFDPATSGRLQQFQVSDTAPANGKRFFAQTSPDGQVTLQRLPDNGRPERVATQSIQRPNELPSPKIVQRQQASTPPGTSPGPDRQAAFASFVSRNCTGCHSNDPVAGPGFTLRKGSKTLSLADAVAALNRVPAMRSVNPSVKQGLAAFAAAQ